MDIYSKNQKGFPPGFLGKKLPSTLTYFRFKPAILFSSPLIKLFHDIDKHLGCHITIVTISSLNYYKIYIFYYFKDAKKRTDFHKSSIFGVKIRGKKPYF
jgi:hypothetical protein